MSGHRPFNELTKGFFEERARGVKEMAAARRSKDLAALQARYSLNFDLTAAIKKSEENLARAVKEPHEATGDMLHSVSDIAAGFAQGWFGGRSFERYALGGNGDEDEE